MKNYKIIVYKDNLSTGRGADKAVRNLASGLAERGYDVELMEKDAFHKFLDDGRIVDVIIATGSNEIVDLYKAKYFERSNRAKVVLQLHLAPRGFFKWKHPLRNMRIRRAFDKADVAVVLCASYEKEFHSMAPHPKLSTISNWADADVQNLLDIHKEGRNKTIIYPAAALNKVKNQKLIIKAFSLLAEDFPDWEVRLLGKTTTRYAAECKRLICKLELERQIKIVGFSNDLKSEYANASFVAFPSLLEGFPLAIIEAAQYGLPTVAQKRLPGISDIVLNGETGIVCDSSPLSYAHGLRTLMENSELRAVMGDNARKCVHTRNARSTILDMWENLIDSMPNP